MSSDWLVFRLVTATVAGTACFVFAAFLFLFGKDRRVSRLFAFSNLFLGLWNISDPAIALAPTHGAALLLDRLSYLWATLLILVFFRFVSAVLGRPALGRTVSTVHVVFGFVVSAVTLTPYVIRDVKTFGDLLEIPGPLYSLFSGYFLFTLVASVLVFNSAWRRAEGLRRNQLKYLALGVGVGLTAGVLYFVSMFVPGVPPFYFVVELVYVSLIPITIVRVRMMDITLALRFSVVYLVLGLGLGLPLGALMWILSGSPWVGGLAMVLPSVGYFFIQRGAGKVLRFVDLLPFFRGRYGALRMLEHHEREVAQGASIPEWAVRLVKAIQEVLSPEFSFVLIRDDQEGSLVVSAGHGIDDARKTFLSISCDGPLASRAKLGGILLKEVIENEAAPDLPQLQREMGFLGAEVTAPIYSQGRVEALLCLGPKIGRDMYNDVDLAGLHGLAKSAELALCALLSGANSELKTAAWAHDLLQPFGPKGALGVIDGLLAGKYGELSPSAQQALEKMKVDMNFINRNLKRVVAGGPVSSIKRFSVRLGEVYGRVRERYAPPAREREITLTVAEVRKTLTVSMDATQFERRVLGNLIENALRHTPKGGTVEVGCREEGSEIIGWVKDTGPGINPQDREKIFEPGVQLGGNAGIGGLGLHSARSVLAAHGGRVWVDPASNNGACFLFALPK
jgi:anti-sigma regulatory factor (Ser/Thr protein kinase)